MSWISRLSNVFSARRLDAQLDEEFRSHLEERIEHLVAGGMERTEAERFARRQFGNRVLLREESHEAKTALWLESAFQDIRFGCRVLWKDRTAMGAAVLSLALALGACSTAFSLIDALLLRPLAVSHSERLFYLAWPDPRMHAPPGVAPEQNTFSYPMFQRFKDAGGSRIALFGANLSGALQQAEIGGGETEPVRVEAFSGNGFGLLGVTPELGRLITEDDDTGARPVAVISHIFWARRLGGDPSVLGRAVTMAGKQFRIVGVARKSFFGLEPGYLTDLWIPLTAGVAARTLAAPDAQWISVWGESNPGDNARQSLEIAFTNFRRDTAGQSLPAGTTREQAAAFINAPLIFKPAANGADSLFRLQFTRPLWIFGLFSGLLLLIAASNVANLFMARATAREHEIALRIAIGAGRGRLLRQLLIESALLAALACALAIAMGSAAAPFLAHQLGASNFPAYLDVHPDWRLFGFLSVAGVLTTLLFGAVPAFRASSVHPDDALKTSAKQSSRSGALKPLLPIQVAFSFMVLFFSGLLLISFDKLVHVDLGFAKDHVALFTIGTQGANPGGQRELQTRLLDRIGRVNGVRSASLSQQGPIGGAFAFIMTPFIRFPGRQTETLYPTLIPVSPGFFSTMQIRLLAGREFNTHDADANTPPPAIINEAFAQRFFPGENPLGRRFEQTSDEKPVEQQIVGVAANSLFNNLRETVTPTIYTPLRNLNGAALEVRTWADPVQLMGALRREIESVNPSLRVRSSILQSTRIADTLVSERLLAWIAGFFAISAVVLVAVGLHGVISYFVVRRTREIGIRMALGAERWAVVRMVIGSVAMLIGLGMALGAATGVALSRYAVSLLFEITPVEFLSMAAPLAAILIACAAAALRPAIRAARVDPVIALRYE
jgi:putative ABC transport system permease protein